MAGDADPTYVIRSGVDALGRLEMLARLFWPSTESLLARNGVLDTTRFLDVGCGLGDVASRIASRGTATVMGIDVDPDVVAAATARAAGRTSAVFRTATLADLGSGDLRDFDVVFSRCLISHLPDPATAVRSLFAAARPGGTVLIEDVEVAAVWSSPRCGALARHVELYVAAASGLGAHPDVGMDLAGHLHDAGATDVHVEVVQPVLRAADDLRIHARTMEAIAAPVLAQGLASATEIEALVAELDAWAATPGVVATLPRVVQVSARRPS